MSSNLLDFKKKPKVEVKAIKKFDIDNIEIPDPSDDYDQKPKSEYTDK